MPTAWLSLKKSFVCKPEADDVHDPLNQKSSRTLRGHHRHHVLKNYIHSNFNVPSFLQSSCSPRSTASNEFLNPVSRHQVIINDSGSSCQLRSIARRESKLGSGGARQSSSSSDCRAVTELCKGDSSRNVVEIIFRTSWLKPLEINSNNNNNSNSNGNLDPCDRIERVLKVHNMQRTVTRFEEYREMVKAKASRLSKKHPRCLADGNELLRFHGTTLMCSLGMNGDSSLCTMAGCNVCRIIRTGFSNYEEEDQARNLQYNKGIYTTATSGRAHEYSIAASPKEYGDAFAFPPVQRAMLVCRVIAGRVFKPIDEFDPMPFSTAAYSATASTGGFDSVAGELAGQYYNTEELVVFNSRAVLPCFVVIYRSD